MAVYYVVNAKVNPQAPEAEKKYYAQAKIMETLELKDLAKRIMQMCTVNSADVMAVLDALSQVMVNELSAGNKIQLGDFGSFRMSIRSRGTASEADFNSNYIHSPRVRYREGGDIKSMLSSLKYEKVSYTKDASQGSSGGE